MKKLVFMGADQARTADQVGLKQHCLVTEDGLSLELLEINTRDILSRQQKDIDCTGAQLICFANLHLHFFAYLK